MTTKLNRKKLALPVLHVFVFFLMMLFARADIANAARVDIRIRNWVITKEVKSFKEKKFDHIVRQTKDYSCGPAALATILTYYFGEKISEAEILSSILLNADQETIRRIKTKGISLLDLKKYGETKGLTGKGFLMAIEQMQTLDRPAIALINLQGYSHFVVVKGVTAEGKVYLADPARGSWILNEDAFEKMWNGVLLVFKRNEGEKITSHDLQVAPFWSQKKRDLMATGFFDVQFTNRPGEF